MKFGSLVGIGIAHDLMFSDFWSMASEPIGSKQREHCYTPYSLTINFWLGYKYFHII